MKTRLLALFSLLPLSLIGAEAPMLVQRDASLNYYLSANIEFSEVNNHEARFAGLEFGTCIDDRVSLGVGLYGLVNDVELDARHGMESMEEWDFWYLGGIAEYHFTPYRLVDVSLECLIGAAWADLAPEGGGSGGSEVNFLIVRPTLNLTLNVTETLEIGGGVGYRYMDEGENEALTDHEASGVVGRLFFRINEF